MILVPMDAPGVKIERILTVFGYDHAPHGHAEVSFDECSGPGLEYVARRGKRIRDRAGTIWPGRIHHCMRCIGVAERALETMCKRVQSRVAFGKPLAEQGTIRADIATSRMEIEQARLLVLKAAHMMDTVGNKVARAEIAMIKVIVPNDSASSRSRDSGARWRRCFAGHVSGQRLGPRAHLAPGRRAGRSAHRSDRQIGVEEVERRSELSR